MSIGRRVGEGHGHCQARRAVDAVEVPQGHAADGATVGARFHPQGDFFPADDFPGITQLGADGGAAAVEIYGVLIGVCVVAAIGDVEDLIAGGGQAKAHAVFAGFNVPKDMAISLPAAVHVFPDLCGDGVDGFLHGVVKKGQRIIAARLQQQYLQLGGET